MQLTNKNFKSGHQVSLLNGGREYFGKLEDLIDRAEYFVHLQVYILDEDDTGRRILEALKKAVARGVKVFLVLDAFGSNSLSDDFVREIKAANIEFTFFGPLFSSQNLSIGRRLHRKVLVIDNREMVIGGINIADKYNEVDGRKPWLDFGVWIKGPVVMEATTICNRVWERRKAVRVPSVSARILGTKGVSVRLAENDWLRGKNNITDNYRKALKNANSHIAMVGTYFLPGRRLSKFLLNAAKRGVEVKIIFTKFTDVHLSKYATQFLYTKLLKHGIKIYEWRHSVVHGKVAVVDEIWSTVGSYNLNFLSAYESIELNAEIYDRDFAVDLKSHLIGLMENDCDEVIAADFIRKYVWYKRIRNWLAYKTVRILMRFLAMISRREKLS